MLNDVTIRKLAVPDHGVRQVPDGKIPGFGVRVTAGGAKSFYLAYRFRGRSRRMNLGRYPVVSLQKARNKALAALIELSEGRDPRAGVDSGAASRIDFAGAVDHFVYSYCQRHNRPSTAAETARLLSTYFVPDWKKRSVADITRLDVVKALEPILERGAPSAARHAFAAIRKFFNWAVEQGLIEDSPSRTIKAPGKHQSRDRVLNEGELAAVWSAAEDQGNTFGVIVRLLILTAQRRGEVCGMLWDEIDFGKAVWTIPAERTKNGKTHMVPLSEMAVELLKSQPRFNSRYVFPARGKLDCAYSGHSKGKRAMSAAAGIENWTLHDLRRTTATGMAQLGVEPHVVECILNHSTGTFGGVAGVYNRYRYLDQMREALEAWEGKVEAVATAASPVAKPASWL